MRVLIACESSGTERDAFLALGHDAMSCDVLPTEVPGPHYQGDVLDLMGPESVTPGVLFLVSDNAPARVIMSAGSGCFARIRVLESEAVFFPPDQRTPEAIAERFDEMSSLEGLREITDTFHQNSYLVRKAAAGLGIASPL